MENKPTPAELERGYTQCDCGSVHLHQAGYEVKLHCCSLCKQFVCTVIQVASEEKCSAWQFTSKVLTYNGESLGNLISLRKGSKGKIVATYFLISEEPLENNSEINHIVTTCIRGPVVGQVPSDQFMSDLPTVPQVETQTPADQ